MANAVTITYYEDDTIVEKCSHGFKMVTGVLVFTTYNNTGTTTTGVALDLSKQIPTKVHYVEINSKGGYAPVYDYTSKKIVVYYQRHSASTTPSALTEVIAATDLSSTMADTRFFAIGK